MSAFCRGECAASSIALYLTRHLLDRGVQLQDDMSC